MDYLVADELDLLRFEVETLGQRMQASIKRRDAEAVLIGVCETMIEERELRIRELEQAPAE